MYIHVHRCLGNVGYVSNIPLYSYLTTHKMKHLNFPLLLFKILIAYSIGKFKLMCTVLLSYSKQPTLL